MMSMIVTIVMMTMLVMMMTIMMMIEMMIDKGYDGNYDNDNDDDNDVDNGGDDDYDDYGDNDGKYDDAFLIKLDLLLIISLLDLLDSPFLICLLRFFLSLYREALTPLLWPPLYCLLAMMAV